MRVVSSAPGKLVLLGEYAVLEGAPAVVMAVNRRAHVTLIEQASGSYAVDARSLGIRDARGRLAGGRLEWESVEPGDAAKLQLAGAVIAASAPEGVGFRASLDTDEFFHETGRVKLGLGSSAALTVALSGALHALRGSEPPAVDRLIAMHRTMQGGRGSGVDIAASRTGGTLVYRIADDVPHVEDLEWPATLHVGCVWSGKSASTGDFLRRIGEWREGAPAQYAKAMDELKSCASAGAMAAQCGDADTTVEAAAAYAECLAEFGRASGANIISAEHVKIGEVAAQSGLVYKTCGAGGGDIGIALTTDPDRLSDFRARIEQTAFQWLDLTADARGLVAGSS
ncbi:MAG TPA: hypothetical protein VFH85_06060 [Gammaproteobacteria bacterium]|nr:hypothetical protein [Gammaproteobacteria bacterium]